MQFRYAIFRAFIATSIVFIYGALLSSCSQEPESSDFHSRLDLKHDSNVQAFAITPDGRTMATATSEGLPAHKRVCVATLWNVANGRKRFSFKPKSAVFAVAFSPDGTLWACGGGELEIRSSQTGALLYTLKHAALNISGITFSRDGGKLAAVQSDGTLEQWELKTRKRINGWNVEGSAGGVEDAIAYTPKGDVILTGGDYDGKLKYWDSKTGALVSSVNAHENAIVGLAVSPDGSKVVTGGWDDKVKVWDFATRKHLFTLSNNSHAWSVALSPDGSRVVSAGSDTRIWDINSGKPLRIVDENSYCVSFVGDNQTIAIANSNRVRIGASGLH